MAGCACRTACTTFLIRVRCRTTWFRRATNRRSRSVAGSGGQTAGRKSAVRGEASMPASILSVLIRACVRNRPHLRQIAIITRATYWDRDGFNAALSARRQTARWQDARRPQAVAERL